VPGKVLWQATSVSASKVVSQADSTDAVLLTSMSRWSKLQKEAMPEEGGDVLPQQSAPDAWEWWPSGRGAPCRQQGISQDSVAEHTGASAAKKTTTARNS
jgi:hypothetical protein